MRFQFADCELDMASHCLSRGGAVVKLEPQVFDLLCVLAENAGTMVTRDQLIETVWKGRIVSDVTISTRINAARTAVGDTGRDQTAIRTIPRRGYALVARVLADAPRAKQLGSPSCARVRYAASADGTQIAWAEMGAGPPLMRSIHFLAHLEHDLKSPVMASWLEELGARHRLIRFDQRGTGLSQAEVEDLSLDRFVEDMLAVADAAGLDRFPVFGVSQGVPVTLRFAARYPDRVSRLVLYGGYAQGRMIRAEALSQEEAEAMVTLMRKGWGQPNSAYFSAYISMFCPNSSHAERASLADLQLSSATAEMAAHIRAAFDHFDVTGDLARIKAPTLVLQSSGDAAHPISQGRILASGIPGAEFKMIESNNHLFLPSTAAHRETMSACLEFLCGE